MFVESFGLFCLFIIINFSGLLNCVGIGFFLGLVFVFVFFVIFIFIKLKGVIFEINGLILNLDLVLCLILIFSLWKDFSFNDCGFIIVLDLFLCFIFILSLFLCIWFKRFGFFLSCDNSGLIIIWEKMLWWLFMIDFKVSRFEDIGFFSLGFLGIIWIVEMIIRNVKIILKFILEKNEI